MIDGSQNSGQEDVGSLQAQANATRAALEDWLRTAFSEAFQGFVHALVVRVFVESILRYGLPPSFQARTHLEFV